MNSYGKDLDRGVDFAWLLEQVNAIPGDFLIRFMTSHPKDAGARLFDTMAACEKVAPVLHLPFQSGEQPGAPGHAPGVHPGALPDLVAQLRARIPDIVLTSDVIVGFPGETQEEFEETLSLIEAVRFDALFTLSSPPAGDPGGETPRPHAQGAEKRQLPAPAGAAEPDFRGEAPGPMWARPSAAWWTARGRTAASPPAPPGGG